MPPSADPVLVALGDEQADLAARLDGLDAGDWDRSSRCEGWSVADVVLHLAQTDELAVASVEGRFDDALIELAAGRGGATSVDDGADALVERERGQPPDAVRARWEQAARMLRQRVEAADPGLRVQWVTGELSVRTLVTTRLAETWIHGGDVAAAVGATPAPTDRLWHVARLAWRTLPYAFARAGRELSGPVAFELRAPSGATWELTGDDAPPTVVRGNGAELCLVAARRVDPGATGLRAEGPDAAAVLELVRTYA